ncbi:M48 family metallopeptidase [Leptolyngbya sp. CCY15150]|uniref:M48 family metallopeptidase n=1 Tax=Leptolyngbya sp. CCY15150 TaxID=2767772 RepID=UPI001EF24AAC|nr:M48 family metallopeptidase [Leptolyngbya sp. CCY15150]
MMNFLPTLYRQLRRRWFYGLMSVVMALGLVLGTPQPGQALSFLELIFRGIQVIQLSNMSDSQEVQIGGQINEQLVTQQFSLYTNQSVNAYIDEIGQALVPYSDRSDIPYVFQVVDDEQVNAFATMGGYVYVTTGLIEEADNEAELASVIGHEIGHIVGRHAVKQMRERAIAAGVASAAGLDRNTAVAIGVELAINRPNSRQDEYEADELGLANLVEAGYAPSAMVSFMEKLLGGGSVPTFLSTHPNTADRIERLNGMIDTETADVGEGLDGAAYTARIAPLS